MDEMVSRDRLHMNNVSYGCIARLLAEALDFATRIPPPVPSAIAAEGERSGRRARRGRAERRLGRAVRRGCSGLPAKAVAGSPAWADRESLTHGAVAPPCNE
jgi:hypothetical protein